MSFRVRLPPSGKEFTAEKNETVLEAALRSGIALNYNCNTGTCGGCGGRIKSGQVRETRQHDFHFSGTQKAQGHALLCVTAAQSDLEIEVKEASGIEDIPHPLIPTKVEQMERAQDDTLILHLRTPRTQTLRLLAGQHLSLAIALELEQPLHLYWMAHRPGNHYLNNLCRSWLDALDNFSYTALTGDASSGESSWEASTDPAVGLRDMEAAGAAIVADHPDLAGFDVYLTAPESGMDGIVGLLQRHGLPKGQLHLDVMKRF